uniref:Tectonic-1-3 N-terminal domain-containing protein n=1 Tax=Anopheles farauti TaxID=69004 RepID=A0A182QNF0_9DIPT
MLNMASSCVSCKRMALYGWLLLVLTLIAVTGIEAGEHNIQRFVKIDVAKINVKNTTDASGNVSSTTPISDPGTESSTTTSSTTEGTTSSITSTTSTKVTEKITSTTLESTTVGSTTTTVPSRGESTEPPFPPLAVGRSAKMVPTGYYCRCDLTINICDINCCCDIDCNPAILRTFDCDQESLHKEEYDHNAGLQSCRVQGGLFCLIEPIYEEGDDSYYNPSRLAHVTRNRWKEVFPLAAGSTSSEEIRFDHYRVDDVVYVYNDTSELVQPYTLPYSLIDGACEIEQPVRYLRDRVNLCRRTVDELSDFNRRLLRHHDTVRFFRTPNKSTVMEHYCVEQGDCLNSTVSICTRSSPGEWNCTQSLNVTDSTTSSDDMLEDDPGTICRELQLVFVHNYTNLHRVQLTLRCHALFTERSTEDEMWEELIWQRISIKFIVATPQSKHDITLAISGNIGYLTQKPLVISHLELPPNGTSTSTGETPSDMPSNPMLAYFTNGTRLPDTSFRLRIPISRRNRCVLTEENHATIDFGVDSFHRCNYVPVDLANQTIGNSQNYTRFCQELQAGLYSQLLHGVRTRAIDPAGVEGYDKLNLYISKYANPINRTSDWVRVRSTNVILDAQPGSEQTTNSDANPNSYVTCSNMLINVEYRFYYARVRVRDVRHQAIMHDGEIVFGPRVNLRFRLDEEIRVPVFIQVQFFDLTSSESIVVVAGLYRLTFLTGFSLIFARLVGA